MTTRHKSTEEAIIALQEITTSLQKTSENHATILQTLTTNSETIQKALGDLIQQVNQLQKKTSDEIESNTPFTDSPKTSVKLDISDLPEILPSVLSINSSGMAVRQKSPAAFVADAEKLNTEPSDSEYESEFDEDDEIRLSEPSENAVYNREGLLDKLGDISWPENVEWIHKLSFDVNQEQEVDVNDDLTREHAFYTQALEGTKDAFLKLKSVGRPFIKPCDYNAPMVKNDTHMEKVKDQLLAEKNRVDESEERRKIREKEKIAKEVQAQKLKEKAKQEKEERKSVAKGRKLSSLSEPAEDDDDDDDDMESDSEDESTLERSNDKRQPGSPGDHSGGLANDATGKGKKEKDKKRKNRDYRNSKNGIGGKKGMKKQNRAETTKKIRGDVKSSGFFKNKRGKV